VGTLLDNDFIGMARPAAFADWTLEDKALIAARFWNTLGDELDRTLIRNIGAERTAEFNQELFRVHQREFFVSGCQALGISEVTPDTKKCVLYHCLSTALGGARSRYAIESDSKAWIFYLPDTMSAGGGVYGDEAHLAAFRGWYANNGVALGNDSLAFVVTHLLARGDPYDAGYFVDSGLPVAPEERCTVQFGAVPPPLSARRSAAFDPEVWPEARRLKALRNFAFSWAWDRIVGAVELLGDVGVEGVRHAFEIVINSYLPYFAVAIGGDGASMVGRYFAAVHEIAGVRVNVVELGAGVQVELGVDPIEQSSFELSEGQVDATRRCIAEAWSRITADYGLVIENAAPTVLTFSES